MVNLFGLGFVGGEYAKRFPVVVNLRDNFEPQSNNILYFISTIHNYHVFTNPFLDIDTNLNLLVRTLENAKKIYGSDFTFNFISSWFVYGNTEMPAKENSPCNPKGFYSITKKTAEDLLISYCNTFKIRYRILRLANVLGINDNKVSAQKNALQYIIKQLQNNQLVELYDNGDFYRDYIDVDDAVTAINLVITEGELDNIYNISNGRPTKFKHLVDYVANKMGSYSQIIPIQQRDFHRVVQVKTMYLDNEKIQKLGYMPKYSIYQTLDKLIAENKLQ